MPGSGRDVRVLCGVRGIELQCIHLDAGADTTWIGMRGGLRGARVQGVRGRRVWERLRGRMPGGGQLQQSRPMPGSERDVRVLCGVRRTELQCFCFIVISAVHFFSIEHRGRRGYHYAGPWHRSLACCQADPWVALHHCGVRRDYATGAAPGHCCHRKHRCQPGTDPVGGAGRRQETEVAGGRPGPCG